MAGPTSSVLLESIPSILDWGKIENVIKAISNNVDGNDFWIINTEPINGSIAITEGRPFGIEKNKMDADYYDYTAVEISMIQDYVGFTPKFDLGIYAMCNRDIDHQILGELTLYFAEEFNGLVNFGGQLPSSTKKLEGDTWEIPYDTSGGMSAVYTLADVTFMRSWLRDGNFRMIK